MRYPQLCASTTALQTAVMGNTRDAARGKHEGCCDGKIKGVPRSAGKVGENRKYNRTSKARAGK